MPTRCKEKQKGYQRNWYEKNKAIHGENVRRNKALARDRTRAWRTEYFKTHPCVDCGEDDPIVLDFDHVKGEKLFDISKAVYAGYPTQTLEDEAAKCQVRCANCHRRVTHQRRLDL